MERPLVSFFVPGKAETKGSARAFVVKGRAIITNDNPRAKAWASVVTLAAHEAMNGRAPLEGPLYVRVFFELPRPKAHFTKKGLRLDAPKYAAKKPDVDKLLRCGLDALTGVVFVDDAQIAQVRTEKRYAEGAPGTWFDISPCAE